VHWRRGVCSHSWMWLDSIERKGQRGGSGLDLGSRELTVSDSVESAFGEFAETVR
jgi:hypothetical protein